VGYYYICLELYAGPFGLIEMIGSLGETNLLALSTYIQISLLAEVEDYQFVGGQVGVGASN
jgi:hypothetical protein